MSFVRSDVCPKEMVANWDLAEEGSFCKNALDDCMFEFILI